MSVMLANNANGGVNGATVTYFNCGETSGDAWDYISIGAGATATYSTQNARGGMSYKFTTGASAGQVMVEWEKFATPLSTIYVRFNVFMPAYPATSTRFCEINDGTTTQLSIGIRSDGTISVRDNPQAQMAVTTVPLPVGRWCRVEFRATSSATTGQITLRTYREVDSPYPTETVNSAATFNTQSNGIGFNKPRFGLTGISVANATCYMDDIAVSSSDYLGPADANANGPLLHRNSAEMGTSGTTIDASNPGDSINASFDLIRGSDPITFNSSQAAHGALSYRILPTAGQESFFVWTRAATSSMAARFYIYFTGFPGSLEEFGQLTTTDAISFTSLARLAFTPTNNLRVIDSSGAALWTSSNPMVINTWYRFEIYAALGGTATTGTIQAAYYALDNTTAIDSFSTSSANLGTTNFAYLRIGKIGSSSSWNTAMYIDDVAQKQQASGFIGPVTNDGMKRNTTEGQASGTTLTAANSGGGSGYAFDGVSVSGTTTQTFSSAQAMHGSRSYAISGSATSTVEIYYNTPNDTTGTQQAYYYFTAYPSATCNVMSAYSDEYISILSITNTGRLNTYTNVGLVNQSTSGAIPLNTWVRLDLVTYVGTTNSNGRVQVKLSLGDSTSPVHSYDSGATTDTGIVPVTTYIFGKLDSAPSISTFYMDDVTIWQGTSGVNAYLGIVPPLGWGRRI